MLDDLFNGLDVSQDQEQQSSPQRNLKPKSKEHDKPSNFSLIKNSLQNSFLNQSTTLGDTTVITQVMQNQSTEQHNVSTLFSMNQTHIEEEKNQSSDDEDVLYKLYKKELYKNKYRLTEEDYKRIGLIEADLDSDNDDPEGDQIAAETIKMSLNNPYPFEEDYKQLPFDVDLVLPDPPLDSLVFEFGEIGPDLTI